MKGGGRENEGLKREKGRNKEEQERKVRMM